MGHFIPKGIRWICWYNQQCIVISARRLYILFSTHQHIEFDLHIRVTDFITVQCHQYEDYVCNWQQIQQQIKHKHNTLISYHFENLDIVKCNSQNKLENYVCLF